MCGVVGGWVAHEILVSAQGPLVLALGLRVWGQGLTILPVHVIFIIRHISWNGSKVVLQHICEGEKLHGTVIQLCSPLLHHDVVRLLGSFASNRLHLVKTLLSG